MFLDALLNSMPLWVFLLLMAFLISLLTTVIYKYTTDQDRMKFLKEETNKLKEEIKKAKDNPQKFEKIQKQMLEYSLEQMRASFKPTLYTFIPIILIFAWFNAALAYQPILPNESFTLTAEIEKYAGNITLQAEGLSFETPTKYVDAAQPTAAWMLKGPVGTYKTALVLQTEKIEGPQIIITTKQKYAQPLFEVEKSSVTKILLDNKETKPFGNVSILGWNPGWLGTYIIFSIIFSLALRKMMKLY